jgi:hypothetical protein
MQEIAVQPGIRKTLFFREINSPEKKRSRANVHLLREIFKILFTPQEPTHWFRASNMKIVLQFYM